MQIQNAYYGVVCTGAVKTITGGGANDHICAICLTNFFEIDCCYIVEYEYINISPLNHCSAGASGGLLLLFIVVGVWNNVADLEDVPATNY